MSSLSASNTSALKLLASFGNEKITKIVDLCFACLLDPETENNLKGDEANSQIGLASIITLFARQASSADSLKPILKDSGLSETAINYICQLYNKKVDIIRSNLSKISISYPKVIGCEWRLDYSVSNSETGSVLQPLFFVQIKVEGGSSIDFTCNEEEMATLVASLKEATAEAQRTKL